MRRLIQIHLERSLLHGISKEYPFSTMCNSKHQVQCIATHNPHLGIILLFN